MYIYVYIYIYTYLYIYIYTYTHMCTHYMILTRCGLGTHRLKVAAA